MDVILQYYGMVNSVLGLKSYPSIGACSSSIICLIPDILVNLSIVTELLKLFSFHFILPISGLIHL